jgi:orotidine-5'-phosphate decarboxylase
MGSTGFGRGLEFCALAVLEAVLGTAAAIKPQVSFFERFGSQGYRVLERLMSDARDADILIVADAKRGDVASPTRATPRRGCTTLAARRRRGHGVPTWASTHSRRSSSSPNENGRGVFVLAATSNEDGRTVQLARTSDNVRVEDVVLRAIAELNQRDDGLGSVGAVLGATRDRPEFNLSTLGGPFLVPGVGSQGATAEHVARLFGNCPSGTVLPSVSRSVLDAGPERAGLRDAAQRWRDDLSAALL